VVGALWFLAPLLVACAVGVLLLAYEHTVVESADRRRRYVRLGGGLLVAALVLTLVGLALDDRAPAKAPQGGAGTSGT
jgi:multisubunit Na+/H+ antiporter MnhB subunit